MPTYSSKCLECGEAHTYIRKIADREDTPVCCGVATTKTLDAPQIGAMSWTGWNGFEATGREGDKTYIESGAGLKKWMDKNNYVPASEGNQEAVIKRTDADKAAKRKLREDVTRVVNSAFNK